MMSFFKAVAKRVKVYHAIRYSRVYREILKFKNPDYVRALEVDLAFYRSALGDNMGLIFDVGANHGDKAWAFRQVADKVVCFEPDEACFEALSRRYRRDDRVEIENTALGSKAGTGAFFVEEAGSAFNTLNEKERDWIINEQKKSIKEVIVHISTLDLMIEKYGHPDFIKIDVEGGEEEVFKGLSSSVSIICFEANLPRFRDETVSIIDRFSTDTRTKFNLRCGDDFVFDSHKQAGEIMDVIMANEETSYDVFVYCQEQ